MKSEYDMSKGERGKFFNKVDTANPIVTTSESLDEMIDDEISVLETNLERIRLLHGRLSELDPASQKRFHKRLASASEVLDEIALSR